MYRKKRSVWQEFITSIHFLEGFDIFFSGQDYLLPMKQTMYSSELTDDNQKYKRKCEFTSTYSYKAIQINVVMSGLYSLSSLSGNQLYGCLYTMYFNPYGPTERSLLSNANGCVNFQFKINHSLQPNCTYILVVTPFERDENGNFSILGSGPDEVTFNPISKANILPITSKKQTLYRNI